MHPVNNERQETANKNTITLPLHNLGDEPLLRVSHKHQEHGQMVVYVETPKPLFFSGQCYAYHWDYKVSQMFCGEHLEECLHRAREWANYLLTYEEDRCYSATGPLIQH